MLKPKASNHYMYLMEKRGEGNWLPNKKLHLIRWKEGHAFTIAATRFVLKTKKGYCASYARAAAVTWSRSGFP